jgi:lipopolysaccharide/colanic/teichoic acid biosynthesis glycosyltransferase
MPRSWDCGEKYRNFLRPRADDENRVPAGWSGYDHAARRVLECLGFHDQAADGCCRFFSVAAGAVFLLVAALIRLTSKGPVFFRQTRIGYGKRPFEILKFRTMVVDAEKLMSQVEHLNETNGPTFKLKNDPRITPLGRFLRKSSLDEIPQLVNVFLGDMSLVGPRPLPVRDYEGFSKDWHRRRFSVKPGITCLWQVMGRSSISFDEWMALDMRYIDQWSVWLDIKILFQTIPAVFRGSGAV